MVIEKSGLCCWKKAEIAGEKLNKSNLIVLGFDNDADAFEMRAALARLQSQYLIQMDMLLQTAPLTSLTGASAQYTEKRDFV
jgi:hypothetical protein